MSKSLHFKCLCIGASGSLQKISVHNLTLVLWCPALYLFNLSLFQKNVLNMHVFFCSNSGYCDQRVIHMYKWALNPLRYRRNLEWGIFLKSNFGPFMTIFLWIWHKKSEYPKKVGQNVDLYIWCISRIVGEKKNVDLYFWCISQVVKNKN